MTPDFTVSSAFKPWARASPPRKYFAMLCWFHAQPSLVLLPGRRQSTDSERGVVEHRARRRISTTRPFLEHVTGSPAWRIDEPSARCWRWLATDAADPVSRAQISADRTMRHLLAVDQAGPAEAPVDTCGSRFQQRHREILSRAEHRVRSRWRADPGIQLDNDAGERSRRREGTTATSQARSAKLAAPAFGAPKVWMRFICIRWEGLCSIPHSKSQQSRLRFALME